MPKINLVVSEAAKAKLEAEAEKAGVRMADYIRARLKINDVKPGRPAKKAAKNG